MNADTNILAETARSPRSGFEALRGLTSQTRLKLVEDFQEVPGPAPVSKSWNEQAARPASIKWAYILVCLPILFCATYWIVRLVGVRSLL
jgi:hypothetical protein